MASRTPAIVGASVLLAVVVFQVALVLGAPWGQLTQGGGTVGALAMSGRAIAAFSAGLLCVMASGLLAAAGLGPMRNVRRRAISVVVWFTTIYSGLGVVMNLVSPSIPERLIFTPVTLVGFTCSVLVLRSWSNHRSEVISH